MQPLHLFLFGFHHHDSGHLTDGIISESLQRASMCVPAVVEPQGFEKVWICHEQS